MFTLLCRTSGLLLVLLLLAPETSTTQLTSASDADAEPQYVWQDVDADDLPDLYHVAPGSEDILLRNLGDGTLVDATHEAGLAGNRSRAASWQDFDGDGVVDLMLVTQDGGLRLYRGVGSGSFERADAADLARHSAITSARWIDFDRDGRPDLWVERTQGPALLHNDGRGAFTNVALGLNIAAPAADSAWTSVSPPADSSGPTNGAKGTLARSGAELPTVSFDTSTTRVEVTGTSSGHGALPLGGGGPTPTVQETIQVGDPACAQTIEDQADPNNCLGASSNATLGFLYPLSSDLYIDNGAIAGGALVLDAADTGDSLLLQGEGTNGGGEISVRDADELQSLTLAGDTSNGPELRMFDDSANQTVQIVGDALGTLGGAMSLFNGAGQNRFQILGDAGDLGGRISMANANGFGTITLDAEADASGGAIGVENSTGSENIRLVGDDGSGNGSFEVKEGDGSSSFRFVGNNFDLLDASGAVTVNFNRQTGTKSGVVKTTSYGQRLLYAVESPEVWFEDFGQAQLSTGSVRVDLDPVFLETVTVNGNHPMHVHVTLTASSPGVWVEKGAGHFIVHELPGGSGDASLDWRVVAKRKGLENVRLEPRQ